jgi:hypothetical protein
MAKSFECSDCGERLPLSRLSETSVKRAGAISRTRAFFILAAQDTICDICDGDIDEYAWVDMDHGRLVMPARSDRERFDLDGVSIDPGRLAAYYLNY